MRPGERDGRTAADSSDLVDVGDTSAVARGATVPTVHGGGQKLLVTPPPPRRAKIDAAKTDCCRIDLGLIANLTCACPGASTFARWDREGVPVTPPKMFPQVVATVDSIV